MQDGISMAKLLIVSYFIGSGTRRNGYCMTRCISLSNVRTADCELYHSRKWDKEKRILHVGLLGYYASNHELVFLVSSEFSCLNVGSSVGDRPSTIFR